MTPVLVTEVKLVRIDYAKEMVRERIVIRI